MQSIWKCVLHFLIRTHTKTYAHIRTHKVQGGEPQRSWFRCPSLTCSVQDFLQDVATKPVPDSSVSLFTSSLSLCLLRTRERDEERGRQRERKKSASNLKVLPGCPPLGPNSPLRRGRPPSASLRKTQIKFINKTVCLWLAGEPWLFAFILLMFSCVFNNGRSRAPLSWWNTTYLDVVIVCLSHSLSYKSVLDLCNV